MKAVGGKGLAQHSFELGLGWAEMEIEVDDRKYFSVPSCLSDPLKDLLEGLLSIIPSCVPEDELKSMIAFKWYLEPAADKWTLELTDDLKLKIVIEEFEDEFEDEFADKGKIGFDVTCNLLDFLNEVIKSLEQLLKKHGFVGYKNTWYLQDFPISSFLKLKYYLNYQTTYPTLKELNDGAIKLEKSDLEQDVNLLLGDIEEN
ncbi:hypothetical protein G9F71_026695 [Clostridium sp. FP2]|uniref:hypothetical protein n=1 Tax=Clostridium sp. FP2 TaxID=2724481 RepID=UPI0013E912A6|nr:hypothetical protein [Clostridium sp. FP2]MBZ9626395.1 hypothetical protein [Clostridium sp. FP2]